MNGKGWRGRLIVAAYLAVAGATLTSAGCLLVAAGAAGGAAAAGYYYYSQGKICQAYRASLDDSLAATRVALNELAMPVVNEDRTTGTAYLESRTGDGDRVRIYLEQEAGRIPADGVLTRVCVRVATFGDDDVSGRILNQLSTRLTPVPPPGPPVEQTPPANPGGTPLPPLRPQATPVTNAPPRTPATVPPQTAAPPLAN